MRTPPPLHLSPPPQNRPRPPIIIVILIAIVGACKSQALLKVTCIISSVVRIILIIKSKLFRSGLIPRLLYLMQFSGLGPHCLCLWMPGKVPLQAAAAAVRARVLCSGSFRGRQCIICMEADTFGGTGEDNPQVR